MLCMPVASPPKSQGNADGAFLLARTGFLTDCRYPSYLYPCRRYPIQPIRLSSLHKPTYPLIVITLTTYSLVVITQSTDRHYPSYLSACRRYPIQPIRLSSLPNRIGQIQPIPSSSLPFLPIRLSLLPNPTYLRIVIGPSPWYHFQLQAQYFMVALYCALRSNVIRTQIVSWPS